MFFVEIGAGYHDTLNYLADVGWEGIIVEPIADNLKLLDRKPGIIYENAAISDSSGLREFWYYPEHSKGPYWLRDLGTLNEGFTDNQSEEVLAQRVCVRVNTLTPTDLLTKCGVKRIDFLKIDAETHDAVILMAFPWSEVSVAKVRFEHVHLSPSEDGD